MKTPFIFILLGTILFLNACIKTTHVSNPTVHSGLPVSQESFIQLIHASPGTPGIKLWQNQKTFQTVGNYYKSNTQYFPIQSGETALEIKRSSNGLLLATIPASLKAGQYYSLFACDSPSRFTPVLISDNPQPLKEDKTQIRLVNIMSSGEPIDLLLDGKVIFNSVLYKGASGYVYVNPGLVKCTIRKAGAGANTSLIQNYPYSLDAGKTYTIYVNGFSYLTGASGADAIFVANN